MTDTIDRDELLRELTKHRADKEHDRNLGSGFYKMGYMDGFDDAINIVDSVPPADVGPVRRGTWKPTEAPFMNECEDCSVCGYRAVWGHRFNYCPHCGAKMEGETHDNN